MPKNYNKVISKYYTLIYLINKGVICNNIKHNITKCNAPKWKYKVIYNF